MAAGLSTAAFMLFLTVLSFSLVPWMDPWFFFYQVDKGNFSALGLLWAQHNGHRIIFPKLFDLADFYLFSGKSIFLLVSIYLVQLLHCGLLIYCLRRLGGLRGSVLRSAAGFILFCLFSPAKREDFICGWEIAYVLPMFLGSLAFAALALSNHKRPGSAFSRLILLSWLAALAGSFSLTSGFLIWPILCVEALLLRLPRRTVLTTAIVGAVALGVNAVGFQSNNHLDLAAIIQNYPQVLGFYNVLLGESWQTIGVSVGVTLAWLGSLLCAAAVVLMIWRPAKNRQLEIVLLLIALDAAAAAALTAIGRWNIGFTNRYEEPVLLFWAALGLLVFALFKDARWRPALPVLQVILLSIMAAGATQVRPLIAEAKLHKQMLDVAGAALASRVMDPGAIQFISMPAAWTFGELDFLKSHAAALYSERPDSLLGTNLKANYKVLENDCSGELKSARFIGDSQWPGLSMRGSAWDHRDNRPLDRLLVTDDTGAIVGLGASDGLVRSTARREQVPSGRTTWVAFAPAAVRHSKLHIFGLLPKDAVCPIGDAPPPDQLQQLPSLPEPASKLTLLWDAAHGVPRVVGGTAAIHDSVLTIRSANDDTQVYFDIQSDLSRYSSLVIKAKFSKADTVELFFGRQLDGRGIQGQTPTVNKWLLLQANVSLNQFWKKEAGSAIRFDPTGSQGRDSITEIAQIWGSSAPANSGADSFESYKLPVKP